MSDQVPVATVIALSAMGVSGHLLLPLVEVQEDRFHTHATDLTCLTHINYELSGTSGFEPEPAAYPADFSEANSN